MLLSRLHEEYAISVSVVAIPSRQELGDASAFFSRTAVHDPLEASATYVRPGPLNSAKHLPIHCVFRVKQREVGCLTGGHYRQGSSHCGSHHSFPRRKRAGFAGEELHELGCLLLPVRSQTMSGRGRAQLREKSLILRGGRHGEAAFPAGRLLGVAMARSSGITAFRSLAYCTLSLSFSSLSVQTHECQVWGGVRK